MDANPIFDKSMTVGNNASVMTVSESKRITPPGIMKKYFAEHQEGKKRIADGFAPKWSITGPKWQISI